MIARIALLALLAVGPALPQCAMCREAAATQREEAIAALNQGILILGLPVAVLFGALGWISYRFAQQDAREQQVQPPAA